MSHQVDLGFFVSPILGRAFVVHNVKLARFNILKHIIQASAKKYVGRLVKGIEVLWGGTKMQAGCPFFQVRMSKWPQVPQPGGEHYRRRFNTKVLVLITF